MVLSPADMADEGPEYHPLLAFIVISQPGLARGQIYYPLISLQIAKSLQVDQMSSCVVFICKKMCILYLLCVMQSMMGSAVHAMMHSRSCD